MFERVIWLTGFALLLVITYGVWRYYLQQQTKRLALAEIPTELTGLALETGPAVLYFTTATCAQCRFQQTPTLAQVQRQLDQLQVLKLDAIEHRGLADYFHVMTVPTTVVLNGQRRPVAINHGLASADRLLEQLHLAL